MREWLLQNWFRITVAITGLLVASSVFYYYVFFIPQRSLEKERKEAQAETLKNEREAEAQRESEEAKISARVKLANCLETADEGLATSFYALCVGNEKIGGSAEKCPIDDRESVVSYMTVQQDRYPYFKYVLERREKDRKECFNLYE